MSIIVRADNTPDHNMHIICGYFYVHVWLYSDNTFDKVSFLCNGKQW